MRRRPLSAWEILLVVLMIAALTVPFIKPISEWGGGDAGKKPGRVTYEEHVKPAKPKPAVTTDGPGRGELVYTTHAKERFAERKITESQALMVLQDPEKRTHEKPGEDGGEVYRYERLVDGRKLVIVAEDREEKLTLITGYWDD